MSLAAEAVGDDDDLFAGGGAESHRSAHRAAARSLRHSKRRIRRHKLPILPEPGRCGQIRSNRMPSGLKGAKGNEYTPCNVLKPPQ